MERLTICIHSEGDRLSKALARSSHAGRRVRLIALAWAVRSKLREWGTASLGLAEEFGKNDYKLFRNIKVLDQPAGGLESLVMRARRLKRENEVIGRKGRAIPWAGTWTRRASRGPQW